MQQLFVLAGFMELDWIPYPKRRFNRAGGRQADIDQVGARRQIHGHDEVLVAHGAFGKGLFITQRVAGFQLAVRIEWYS